MKKVKFLKDHLENAKGDVAEVTEERANYFVLTGTAEIHGESGTKQHANTAPAKSAKKTGKKK